ncbi:hypothetical protein CVH13_00018, partial [Dehalococcoides mccartyi]
MSERPLSLYLSKNGVIIAGILGIISPTHT